MARSTTFNTGNPYTAQGQIITITLRASGAAHFNDKGRVIKGLVPAPVFGKSFAKMSDHELQQYVYNEYQHCRYTDA